MIGNRMVIIPRGSLLTGRKSLATAINCNESKITRLLKLFENEQQIEQQTFTKYRLISITNYCLYQEREQQTNNKRTTSEQQVNTNNNVNNDNKLKEYIYTNLTTWPNGFHITDKLMTWANKNKHTRIEEHFDNFKIQCEAKGYKYKNWNSAFQSAIRNDWAKLNKVNQYEENRRSNRKLSAAEQATADVERYDKIHSERQQSDNEAMAADGNFIRS